MLILNITFIYVKGQRFYKSIKNICTYLAPMFGVHMILTYRCSAKMPHLRHLNEGDAVFSKNNDDIA